MAQQFYFENVDAEYCYTEDHFIDQMKMEGITEMTVLKAIPGTEPDFFWCKHYGQMGEKGGCGSICKEYAPKNGKSGCCKHYTNRVYFHGEDFTIQLNK